MKNSPKQKKLFDFLVANSGKHVTEKEILDATGYRQDSFRSTLAKGFYGAYLRAQGATKYLVIAAKGLDIRAFRRQMSQTTARRHIGGEFRHPLAGKLVSKAKENFILALELYNRPSLENRLDSFSQLFCTAWEQLMKAEILDANGEEAVFRPQKVGRRRETISIQECINKLYIDAQDPVRLNLERIAELRHGATHLMMPETAMPISRLFQAGVINFARRFRDVTGEPVLPESAAGLLSMVAAPPTESAVDLKKLYGDITARELASLRSDLQAEIDQNKDERFAISVEYRLVLTKKEGEGDISLTNAAGASPTLAVLYKPVSVEKSHPHFAQKAAESIAQRSNAQFTIRDLNAVLSREGWKNGNNEFHHYSEMTKRHFYSDACIDKIIDGITRDPNYLAEARRKFSPTKRGAGK